MTGPARARERPGPSANRKGRQMKTLKLAMVAAIGLLTSGCGEATEVTVYEPGVYKGAADPLLSKAGDPAYAQAMQDRLQRGQTDRKGAVEAQD